jgi:hypothetical protein
LHLEIGTGPHGIQFAYLLDQIDRLNRIMTPHSAIPAPHQAGQDDPLPLPTALLFELRQALQSIRYGAIEIVIHEGRVVQLERHEKVRFDVEVRDPRR